MEKPYDLAINCNYTEGQEYGPNESDMFTAGIKVNDHGNAIEFFGHSAEEARSRRDYVLGLIALDKMQRHHANRAIPPTTPTDWRAAHGDMVARNAVLRERPDLPVDRIPAHDELVRLQKENAQMRVSVQTGWGPLVDKVIDILQRNIVPDGISNDEAIAEMLNVLDGPYYRALATPHADDLAVDSFAAAMRIKMEESRKKGRSGWEDREACSAENLNTLLAEHLGKGDPVDIGNFAMMLWNRNDPTTAPSNPDQLDASRWRAFLNSARIRIIGSAGIHKITNPNGEPYNGYAHFGMEIWTKYGGSLSWQQKMDMEACNVSARALLIKYADIARTIAHEADGKKPEA